MSEELLTLFLKSVRFCIVFSDRCDTRDWACRSGWGLFIEFDRHDWLSHEVNSTCFGKRI